MDERAVTELRELDRQDAELAAAAERLRSVDRAVGVLRHRAEEIDSFFAAYPAAESKLRAAVDHAREDVARRQAEVGDSEAAVARARDEETRRAAERALRRATDHMLVARERLARASADHADLERRAAVLPNELPRIEEEATRWARELPDVPTPERGAREVIEWASRVHASVFVAAGHMDAQRGRLIDEANELASVLLGQPTFGATAAQARERVEAALRD